MNKKIVFLLLPVLLFPACSTTKSQGLTEAIPLKITGPYEGQADISGDIMEVSLFDMKTDELSTYKNVKPLTGGNYIPVYFDTDKKIEGAEYCAFIYADEIAFREDVGAGWYTRELAVLPYHTEAGNLYFDIPLKYFLYKPFSAWTQKSY